ncbi:photosynthetic complex assembly protein PuhC [Aureimonas leprariae]|uniref:Photosynthetic complex assembly protein n=1 Tax=Plantimonas leprariae TaxID=2615207 RepID=A0A7V7PQD6_9HYPH|nr:photosynthetic complex assembly protein PuhC [Aureimonas leprariae]KAB0680330.1 photosynthetic complex assembly protein [Aureimonas leprariae]
MSQVLKKDPQRNAVIACGGLIATALVLAVLGRHAPATPVIAPDTASESARLLFGDLADGGVAVTEAGTGREIERLVPGEGGFVRVTMRSFAGDRKRKGLSAGEPFTLARMRNGELLLQDPLTGRTMLLDAFGPSNASVFAELLDHERAIR